MAYLFEHTQREVGVDIIVGFIRKYWGNLGGRQLKLNEFNGWGRGSCVIDLEDSSRFLQFACGLVTKNHELVTAYKKIFEDLPKHNPCIHRMTIKKEAAKEFIERLLISFDIIVVSDPADNADIFRPSVLVGFSETHEVRSEE